MKFSFVEYVMFSLQRDAKYQSSSSSKSKNITLESHIRQSALDMPNPPVLSPAILKSMIHLSIRYAFMKLVRFPK